MDESRYSNFYRVLQMRTSLIQLFMSSHSYLCDFNAQSVSSTIQNLKVTDRYPELGLYSHQKNFWTSTSRYSSLAGRNGINPDPCFLSQYGSVTESGYKNCRNPHNAGGHPKIQNPHFEENNCITCHKGNAVSIEEAIVLVDIR